MKHRKLLISTFAFVLGSVGFVPSAKAGAANSASGRAPTNFVNYGQAVSAQDIGVDCSGNNDSAGPLNAFTAAGGLVGVKLIFPAGTPGTPCLVKLATTWRIYNSTSFTIDGQARCGLPGNCTRFVWAGKTGGTMIDMEGVFGFEVDNISLNAAGTAGTGVIVDQNSASTIATYDGIFQGVLFNANASNSSGPFSGWVGLSVSPLSRANVADIRVIDSSFECMSSGSGRGTIGYGLALARQPSERLLRPRSSIIIKLGFALVPQAQCPRLFFHSWSAVVPEMVTGIRNLLVRQLETVRDGMQAMSKAQLAEYYSREKEIAGLIETLHNQHD